MTMSSDMSPSLKLMKPAGQLADFHDAKITVFAKANNLLNENIRNSVSYLRNFSPEPGRGAEIGFRVNY